MRVLELEKSRDRALKNGNLWRAAIDPTSHWLFRADAMRELVKVNDPKIEDYVISLLTTDDIDQWFTALEVLSLIPTEKVRLALMSEYKRVDRVHKPYVMRALVGNASQEQLEMFQPTTYDF